MIPTQEEILQSFAAGLTSAFLVGNRETIAPTATALPKFFLSSDSTCVLPSLKLRPSSSRADLSTTKRSRGFDKASLSRNLSHPLRLYKNAASAAPSVLLGNLSSSFQTLLTSKLRHTMHGLAEHILKPESSTTKTVQVTDVDFDALKILMLSAASSKSSLSVKGSAAVYYTLPARKHNSGSANEARQMHLPLIFEAVFDIRILEGQDVTVQLRIPGTISGTFSDHQNLLDKIEIAVDSEILFDAMITQCQDLVERAVAAAYLLASQPTGKKARTKSEPRAEGFAKEKETNDVVSMPPPPPPCQDKQRERKNGEEQATEGVTHKKRRIAAAA